MMLSNPIRVQVPQLLFGILVLIISGSFGLGSYIVGKHLEEASSTSFMLKSSPVAPRMPLVPSSSCSTILATEDTRNIV